MQPRVQHACSADAVAAKARSTFARSLLNCSALKRLRLHMKELYANHGFCFTM